MDNDPRYKLVEHYLPNPLPAITREEAERAAKKLFRAFGGLQHGSPNMTRPARLRYPIRRVWISPKPTIGHHKGWGRLIHDVSHEIYAARHPSHRAHETGHHVLERELAIYVAARDWLQGGLRTIVATPTTSERRAVRLAQTQASIARWETKLKRANTALKKLRRREKALQRVV